MDSQPLSARIRLPQFRLRTLLGLVGMICVALAFWVLPALHQQRMFTRIRAEGGWADSQPIFAPDGERLPRNMADTESQWWAFLRAPTSIRVGRNAATDETLEFAVSRSSLEELLVDKHLNCDQLRRVASLPRLRSLSFLGKNLNAETMDVLRRSKRLCSLELRGPPSPELMEEFRQWSIDAPNLVIHVRDYEPRRHRTWRRGVIKEGRTWICRSISPAFSAAVCAPTPRVPTATCS